MKIAILGGGISGLTLARLLAADGDRVVVFERDERIGGLCRSREVGGFTFDEAGGHIMFSKQRDVLDWMIARCGGEQGVVRTERQTRIRWHDRYVPYPFENGIGHLPPDTIVDCLEGYVDAYAVRRSGAPCPPNFRDWILWRMGEGFGREFMFPYNEKLWKCPLERMSSEWVAGRVPEAPVRDILRAAVGDDTQGYAHQAVFWFPRSGGFEAIVHGTADGVAMDLRRGANVQRIERRGSAFAVDGESFDLVVNTAPLPEVEPLFADLPEPIRADIRALQPISLVNVMIGLRLDVPLPPLSWIYLPFPEQGPANRVTFFSNYSPENAPAGHGSLMAEVTHRGDLEPTKEWLDLLVKQLGRAGVLVPDQVVLLDWTDNRYAYIDQDLEFPARIARVRKWFDSSGYATFGRFGRYEYHNSDQCIARAMQVHQQIRQVRNSGDPLQLSL